MMKERLQNIKDEALKAIEAADMPEKLNDVRVKFLGKRRTYRCIKRYERRCTGGQTEGRTDGKRDKGGN